VIHCVYYHPENQRCLIDSKEFKHTGCRAENGSPRSSFSSSRTFFIKLSFSSFKAFLSLSNFLTAFFFSSSIVAV
jgi:hypothetical protein